MLPGLTFSTPLALLLLPPVLGWAAWLWLRDTGNLSVVRHRVALALRLTILGALILVLAGATWLQPTTRQATIFVADLSASMAGLRERETAFIAAALRARGNDDAAAIVAVGGDALVEQPVGALGGFAGFQSVVDRSATDLEAGLNLAGALFPAGYRKRVVLLTDGRQNLGDAAAAARLLREEGARLDVVPLAPPAGVEALVAGVDAPPTVSRGARMPLTVSLQSTVAQSATLDIFDGARSVMRLAVDLPAGARQVALSLPPLSPGFHALRVVLTPTVDTVAENNEGDAFTRVSGAAQVLVAEGLPGEGDVVATALRARHMQVRQILATAIDPSLAALSAYGAVVLVDVPAYELDPTLLDPAHSTLSAYIDGGGGLVVIGGPNSYGVGGYTNTALDDVLPVSMKLPQTKDTPTVAVALIIEDLETPSNVNISKAAGEGVIKLLTPADRVEVNDASGTDNPADNGWAVPLQYVVNKDQINRAIDAMSPVDPGSYVPALTAAYNSLLHVNAKIKHIVLLGDGDAEDSYYPLITKIRKAGITISTVATGGGAGAFGPSDYPAMQNIARWGGGRFYQADVVSTIPQIFLKETKQIARTGLVEEHFLPEQIADSPIVADLPAVPLDGYVATTPKPAGQQVLVHVTKHGVDPLLAQWQYGLGRAVAWTSDAHGHWTGGLVARAQGNALWANMVSWVLPPESSPNLAFSSSLDGNRAHLTVTTSGLPLDAQVSVQLAGAATTSMLTLQPTAPGQYEADAPLTATGAYLVGIRASSGGHVRATLRTGLVIPYAAEYRMTGLDAHLLHDLAALGAGALISAPAASFADNLPSTSAPLPLTGPLLLLALLLLPIDVAARRLLIGLPELRAALALALRSRRALQPAPASAGPAAAPLTAVRARRDQRRARAGLQHTDPAAVQGMDPATRRSTDQAAVQSTNPAAPQPARPTAPLPAQAPLSGGLSRPTAPSRPTQPAPRSSPRAEAPRTETPRTQTPRAEPTHGEQPPAAESTSSKLLEAKRRRRGG